MGYSTVRRIMREGLTDPRNLYGIALWNSTRDVTDLTTDTGIKLWADKSGNSSTNVLCLNGVAGNYASAPDAAYWPTGDIDVRWYGASADWTSGVVTALVGKFNATGNQRSWLLFVNTTGTLQFNVSTDGTTTNNIRTSDAALGYADFSSKWLRAVRVSATGVITLYSSDDGSTWSVIASTQSATASGAIFDSTALLEVGSNNGGTASNFNGLTYRAQVYDGIAGTLVFDANFSLPAKLAPSFTESSSNAATVTINTSGATGARISGARDLYQGTAANQPILTIAASGNYLTFDGSNDYLKAAAFALSQPETVYFVGSQVTWTDTDTIYEGNATGNRMQLRQATPSPQLLIFAGATGIAQNGGLATATNGIITAVFNGASSALRINRGSSVTGQAGTDSANGFTLGSARDGASAWANITAQEVVVYSTAQDENYQYRVTRLLSRRTGVLVV